jgi:hypothetical protein
MKRKKPTSEGQFFCIKKPRKREEKRPKLVFQKKNLHGSSCTAPSPAYKLNKKNIKLNLSSLRNTNEKDML